MRVGGLVGGLKNLDWEYYEAINLSGASVDGSLGLKLRYPNDEDVVHDLAYCVLCLCVCVCTMWGHEGTQSMEEVEMKVGRGRYGDS